MAVCCAPPRDSENGTVPNSEAEAERKIRGAGVGAPVSEWRGGRALHKSGVPPSQQVIPLASASPEVTVCVAMLWTRGGLLLAGTRGVHSTVQPRHSCDVYVQPKTPRQVSVDVELSNYASTSLQDDVV